MKAKIGWGLLMVCLSGPVMANGGGYHYGVRFTGAVKPFEPEGVEKVAILEEKLDIELNRTGAEVRVTYRMKNMDRKGVKVRFGFPVEVADERVYGVDQEKLVKNAEASVLEELRDYRVSADRKQLEVKFREEKFLQSGAKPGEVAEAYGLQGIGGWMVSDLAFAAGQERVVEISYGTRYERAGGSVSDDWSEGAAEFKYRLSTGAVWQGPIRDGVVTVTATGVDPDEVEVFKPVGKFKRDGVRWRWEFKDLEPTLAEDIVIRATPEKQFYGQYGGISDDPWKMLGYFEQGGVWSMVHRDYVATASSALAPSGKLDYQAGNVRGQTYGGEFKAWSEGAEGDGVGEWLQLEPKRATPLFGVEIWPGYGKSDYLFQANNRPKLIEVELNGEHRFEATLDDRNEGQVVRVRDYAKPVGKVRITVKDVYRGTKHRDTCVSDVTLYSRLKKKPEIQGAR